MSSRHCVVWGRTPGRSGFTLLEILIAVAVIGLLGGYMVVNYDGVTQAERLRAAARKLAGWSDFVRSQAASTKRMGYLEIDFELHRYRFSQDPVTDSHGNFIDGDDGHVLTVNEYDEWMNTFEWEELASGVYFVTMWESATHFYKKGTYKIEYRPNGTLSSLVIWLQARTEDTEKDGEVYSVIINGLTGTSEVVRGRATFPAATEAEFNHCMGDDAPGGSGR